MLRKRLGDCAPEVELPITPMLDMTFQLLAFFIFTYQPATLEVGDFKYSLPATPGVAPLDAPVETVPPDDNITSRWTVVLRAQRDGINDGAISAVVVQAPFGETAVSDLPALLKYLKARRADETIGAKDTIRIQADNKLKYAFVIEAVDICTRAGFREVGLAAPQE